VSNTIQGVPPSFPTLMSTSGATTQLTRDTVTASLAQERDSDTVAFPTLSRGDLSDKVVGKGEFSRTRAIQSLRNRSGGSATLDDPDVDHQGLVAGGSGGGAGTGRKTEREERGERERPRISFDSQSVCVLLDGAAAAGGLLNT
jgi:hypothetical protein